MLKSIWWLMIIIGLLLLTLLIPDFAQEYAPAIIVATALVSSIITITFYQRIAPGQKPLTTTELYSFNKEKRTRQIKWKFK
jgi:hypothetical protein